MWNFILGTFSSLFAIFIIWFFCNCFFPEIRRRFFTDIPHVSGAYNLIKMDPEKPHKPEEDAIEKRIILKQCGKKIWGSIINPATKAKSKLYGIISGSRLLIFSFQPENKNIHDYGTAVVKLEFSGQDFKGIVTFLCSCCEEITPTPVMLVKTED